MQALPPVFHRWSYLHAAVLSTTCIAAAVTTSIGILLAAAALMFIVLIGTALIKHSERLVSRANAVTVVRLMCIEGLIWTATARDPEGFWLAAGALVLLVSDAVDGWLARRYDSITDLGGLLDEEVDAFFLLALCTAALIANRLAWWILIPGLLRYGFVLARPALEGKGPSTKIRSRRARVIFVIMMVAMITTLLPFPWLHRPAAGIASLLLIISFAVDIRKIIRARSARPALNQ